MVTYQDQRAVDDGYTMASSGQNLHPSGKCLDGVTDGTRQEADMPL